MKGRDSSNAYPDDAQAEVSAACRENREIVLSRADLRKLRPHAPEPNQGDARLLRRLHGEPARGGSSLHEHRLRALAVQTRPKPISR